MVDILVSRPGDLAEGDVRIVRAGALELGLLRHGGQWHAFRNLCPHQGGPACEGVRMPNVRELIGPGGVTLGQTFDESEMHIVCPWHGYEFRISDGHHVRDDRVKLEKFTVEEREDGVYVIL